MIQAAKRKLILIGICTALCFVAGPITLSAQIVTGAVVGTVKDPTGAVVKGAKVSLVNQATNIAQTTVTSAAGNYVFATVPVGVYTLHASAAGFKTYVDTGIRVQIQATVTADVALAIGSISQHVTVTSAVPLLQAQNAAVGQTIPSVQVNDLPLNGRNWLSLANLSAGTYAAEGSSPDNPGQVYSNGVSNGQVDYRLNGVDNNIEVFQTGANNFAGNVAPVPDAIEEFKLQAGNNSAEFGQFAGAVVNAVIKSGTNRLNGDAWEYLRNQALNANDYFSNEHGVARPKYEQNQFGGTIGGPVYLPGLYDGKNKTFFFFDFQHTGITEANNFTESVPTSSMRSSNFTNLQGLITGNSGTTTDALGRVFPLGTVFDPATTRSVAPHAIDPVSGFTNPTSKTVYVRDPFFTGGSVAGIKNFTADTSEMNIIPANRIDPNAIKLLDLLPAPTENTGSYINDYFVTEPYTTTINQYDVRIDENLSQKDLIWGTFSRSVYTESSYQPFPNLIAGGALQISPEDSEPHYVLSLNYRHAFTANLENVVTFGYDHANHNLTMPTANMLGIPAQYGIQGIPQIAGNGGLPTIGYNGFSTFGGRRYMPTIETTSGLEVMDDMVLTHEKHEFHMGFTFNRIIGDIVQPAYSKGQFTFNGQYTNVPNKNDGLTGIGDMLIIPGPATVPNGISELGGLSSYTGSNYAGTDYFSNYWALYAQDNWRPTSRLTVNLGLRWEYFSPYGESNGRQANFIQAAGDGNSGTYYITKRGCSVPRSAAFNSLLASYHIAVDCVPGLEVNQAQKDDFSPRIGFAYRILPNLVIRSGYAISYGAYDSVGYGGTLGTNYPFQYNISNPPNTSQTPNLLPNGQPATLENTFGVIDLQNPANVTGVGLSLSGKQYHYQTPLVQSVNFTIQDQFTDRDSIQVGYVGTMGRNLDVGGTQNSPTEILPPGVNVKNYIPFPSLAPNSKILATFGISNYNSLQATYQHRFRNNLILLANYTYGKCMTYNAFRNAEYLPGFGVGPGYSLCGSDATDVIHLSGEYALPMGRGRQFFSGASKVVNALIGGWNINYIYTYQSGQPFTVGCPTATTSDFGCNANLVSGVDPYAGPHNISQWLNPKAFERPPTATAIGQNDYAPLGGAANQVRGPSFYNLDMSLFKNFPINRTTSLQFRFETFNTLNHAQFNNPGHLNFEDLTDFSTITSTRNNPRLGQVALKLFF